MTNVRPRLSDKAKGAITTAVYEYLLVVLPVGVYIVFEAVHKNEIQLFFLSPEWSIANIFLSVQGLSLYQKHIHRSGQEFNYTKLGLIGLVSLIVVVSSSINAMKSLEDNNMSLILFRLSVFVIISVLFVLLVGGARFVSVERERPK